MSFTLDLNSNEDAKPVTTPGVSTPLASEDVKPGRVFVRENKLTNSQLEGLNLVEQIFWSTGDFPTIKALYERTSLLERDAKEFYEQPVVLECMQGRNLPVERLVKQDSPLTAQQLMVANMVLNLEDPMSLRQKLQTLGVSVQKFNTWMRDPAFAGYMRSRTEAMFSNADGDAYLGLLQAVRDQDVPAIKLFFEMRGIYNPRVQVDINIELVLTKVVEILARKIDDPQLVMEIAGELEALGNA